MTAFLPPKSSCRSRRSDENLQHTPAGDGPKNKRYEIEWHYSPSDFFPAPINERTLDCDVKVAQAR
jgi:hypothetical protein